MIASRHRILRCNFVPENFGSLEFYEIRAIDHLYVDIIVDFENTARQNSKGDTFKTLINNDPTRVHTSHELSMLSYIQLLYINREIIVYLIGTNQLDKGISTI